MVDYSKWKNIEVSDDEDDTHPNIDTPSLFRWRHQSRVVRMEESDQERAEFEKVRADWARRKRAFESKVSEGGVDEEMVKKLADEEKRIKDREIELEKKERLTPWNVDTIGKDGFSKTVINNPKKGAVVELTEEEKAERFRNFSTQYEDNCKKFGMLSKYEDSKKYLLEFPEIVCEDLANYLVYWCIDLALEEMFELMDHVSHQCVSVQFLLELAKQMDLDPRSCISPFFSKIAHIEQTEYKKAFDQELKMFRDRIRKRAEEKINEALEKDREERLGPGGLDPMEVLENLPESLKKCFVAQDIPLLQKVISELPPEEAKLHMERCVASGLWVPNSKDVEKDKEQERGPEIGDGDK